jgi:hypothetical protein
VGAVRMQIVHTVGEQRDRCMIGAVFEPKKEIPVNMKKGDIK